MVDYRRCRLHRRRRCRHRLPDDEPCCRKGPLSGRRKLPDIGKSAGYAHPGATISDIDDPESFPNVCDPASCFCDEVGYRPPRPEAPTHVVWDDRPIPLLVEPPPRMDTGTYTVITSSDGSRSVRAADDGA